MNKEETSNLKEVRNQNYQDKKNEYFPELKKKERKRSSLVG